ncbi:MAG: NADH-quinone oxidoreductase subunit L [Campylobacterales bacterium]
MDALVLIALFAPLVGSLFAGLFGAKPKMVLTGIVTSSLIFISFIASAILFLWVNNLGQTFHVTLFEWIKSGGVNLSFGFVVDQISIVMMLVVTIVSTVVHIYSMGYMSHDRSYNRFFSYLSAFVFSMMVLVMSDNFLGLFIGWEGVGLCSWLLIGFWYERHSATWAANEAFIMNRIADLGMLLGIFLIFWTTGSLTYKEVFAAVPSIDHGTLTLMTVLLFIGAMGKSAQFPLHTWLADAMEGPTPVSALIHAATMVTAGVYLVVRAHEMYMPVPEVGEFIAGLGAFVAFFAASMGLVNRDLKRIIAYSTLSQLGYMFVAAGLGAYWVALFHLMTHAFFKALLFLGAGNVMHAMHDELDIKKMGGLYKYMRVSAILMIIASIALAGIYPFAGFFSKDKILEVAFGTDHTILWLTLLVTAGMTAFYSFRLIMMVFFGEKNYPKFFPDLHPHEAYPFMLVAMSPLALLAIVSGFFEHGFVELVRKAMPILEPHFDDHGIVVKLIALTTFVVLSGIALAVWKYSRGGFSQKLEENPIYKLLYNQWYIPKLYEVAISRPYAALSRFLWISVDMKIVDAIVDGIAGMIYRFGEVSRAMHSGNLSKMLRWMVVGLVVLIALAILYSPAR